MDALTLCCYNLLMPPFDTPFPSPHDLPPNTKPHLVSVPTRADLSDGPTLRSFFLTGLVYGAASILGLAFLYAIGRAVAPHL